MSSTLPSKIPGAFAFRWILFSSALFCCTISFLYLTQLFQRIAHVGNPAGDKNSQRFRDEPIALQKNSTCEINEDLTDLIVSSKLGWDDGNTAPSWLIELCPNVVRHFDRFPSFRKHIKFNDFLLPFQTTKNSAQVICTMKFVRMLASSINARLYLHAGSHLGATLHGQNIVWDDDVDMWIDSKKKDKFLDVCGKYGSNRPILTHPQRVELHCVIGHNAIKVWLQPPGMKKETASWATHYSPFVDLFLFEIRDDMIIEMLPNGEQSHVDYKISDFFPTRPFYFGGIYLFGPPAQLAQKRYKLQNCVMSSYNHRLESGLPQEMNYCLDCHKLYTKFPFVHDRQNIIKSQNSSHKQKLFPMEGMLYEPQINTTIKERNHWFESNESDAQTLTNSLRNLNEVEVDNSISPLRECQGRTLKIIEFNAERGRRWLESAELLKEADIIILNEMDIGMARSDQQHTTRLLAFYLGMNYVWGLEFIELTLGDRGDRQSIYPSEKNFFGLHGNAILSKCQISNTTIFRNQVGSYFAKQPNNVNAQGLERRLGGRMILLGQIVFSGITVVLGSVHKLNGYQNEVSSYMNGSPAIIAGDQDSSFCKSVGLETVVSDSKHNTWPATCSSLGDHRGDNICSNMKVSAKEYTLKPCLRDFDFEVQLGDHALIGADFELKNDSV